jgi:hypothetical protein
MCSSISSGVRSWKLTFTSVMSFVGYDYVKPICEPNAVIDEEPGDM